MPSVGKTKKIGIFSFLGFRESEMRRPAPDWTIRRVPCYESGPMSNDRSNAEPGLDSVLWKVARWFFGRDWNPVVCWR